MTKVIIIIFSCMCLVACTPKSLPTKEPPVTVMKERIPETTPERISLGKQLYTSKCANCHRLYDASNYTLSQWDKILPRMLPRAKIMDTASQQLIKEYVISVARS